jgi:hypothetical protein
MFLLSFLSVGLCEPSMDGAIMIGFRLVPAPDTSRAALP